jgi:hypothetical protein
MAIYWLDRIEMQVDAGANAAEHRLEVCVWKSGHPLMSLEDWVEDWTPTIGRLDIH